jgi:hypothetical protein
MTARIMKRPDVLTIEVDGDVVIEGDDRQRLAWLRLRVKFHRP